MGRGYWVIVASLLIAATLAVLPLPAWLMWARPEWLALILIYWSIALPHRVGVLTAAVTGLGLDLLEGAPMGQNALALILVASLCGVLYHRMRVFSLWQQAGTVFLLVGSYQLVCQWLQSVEGVALRTSMILLPALTSALLWPLVLHTLRGLRRYFRVE